MIKYALKCVHDHEFDSWFASAASFDEQAARGQVSCPVCASAEVAKAIMAPALAHGEKIEAPSVRESAEESARKRAELSAFRHYVMGVTEDVGTRFSEEARKIAEGTSEERPIRGQATREEAKALLDEGIAILPLPLAPDDLN
ncbi:MAG: DUF1178 family protein [Pseudomonadota bacterium]